MSQAKPRPYVRAQFYTDRNRLHFRAMPCAVDACGEPRGFPSYNYLDHGDAYDYTDLAYHGWIFTDSSTSQPCNPELKYLEKMFVSVSEARRMYKTMQRLERRMERYRIAHGYPQSLGQAVIMFAHALQAQGIVVPRNPEAVGTDVYKVMSPAGAADWIDRRLGEVIKPPERQPV